MEKDTKDYVFWTHNSARMAWKVERNGCCMIIRKCSEDEIATAGQFICIENEEIVGAFVLNDDPQGVYENAAWSRQLPRGGYMVCHALASKATMQGQGIGSRMVAYCIDYAKKNGYQAIRLDVVPENLPARKLYEKCGFRYVGDVDLERNIAAIPMFSMYEMNF